MSYLLLCNKRFQHVVLQQCLSPLFLRFENLGVAQLGALACVPPGDPGAEAGAAGSWGLSRAGDSQPHSCVTPVPHRPLHCLPGSPRATAAGFPQSGGKEQPRQKSPCFITVLGRDSVSFLPSSIGHTQRFNVGKTDRSVTPRRWWSQGPGWRLA